MLIVEFLFNWLKRYAYPLTAFSVSRLGLLLLVYLSLVLFPIKGGDGFWRAFPENLFLDGWSRWDSGWYAWIAQRGYTNIPVLGPQRDTVFFPLYPLLISMLSILLKDVHLSGILISNASFLTALLLLYNLVLDKYGIEIAQHTAALLAFSPFSFFFSAMYTESIFLMSVVSVFYFGDRKRWVLAGISAAAAGASRVVGFLTIIGLSLLYMEQIDFDWRKIRKNILWVLLGLVGPGGYMLFLSMQFGNPLQFISSQYVPGFGEGVNLLMAIDTFKASWSIKAIVTGQFPAMNVLHLLSFIIALSILAMVVGRLSSAYLIWASLTVLASFSLWTSMGRYLIVVFPLYISMALLFSGKKFEFVIGTSALFMGLFAIMFAHWYWVA